MQECSQNFTTARPPLALDWPCTSTYTKLRQNPGWAVFTLCGEAGPGVSIDTGRKDDDELKCHILLSLPNELLKLINLIIN